MCSATKHPFTANDIKEYFDQFRKKVRSFAHLAVLSAEAAHQIEQMTLGVPLADRIAAGVYWETG